MSAVIGKLVTVTSTQVAENRTTTKIVTDVLTSQATEIETITTGYSEPETEQIDYYYFEHGMTLIHIKGDGNSIDIQLLEE